MASYGQMNETYPAVATPVAAPPLPGAGFGAPMATVSTVGHETAAPTYDDTTPRDRVRVDSLLPRARRGAACAWRPSTGALRVVITACACASRAS